MSVAALMQALGQLFMRSNPLHSRYAPLPFYPEAFREIVSEAYTDIADEDSSVFSILRDNIGGARMAVIRIYSADKSSEQTLREFTALLRARDVQYDVIEDQAAVKQVRIKLDQFEQGNDEVEAIYPVVMAAIHRSKTGLDDLQLSNLADTVVGGGFRWSSDTGRKLQALLIDNAYQARSGADFTRHMWFRDKKTAAAAIKAARLSRIRA